MQLSEQLFALEEKQVPLRIAVLVSGSGSNLQALIDAIENKHLPGAEIVLVVSNKADAYGLQRALQHKLPTIYLPWRQRAEAESKTDSFAFPFPD